MKKGNRTWGTKDNGYIRVVDMADSHLTNAFRMLYKQGRDRKTSYDYCYLQDEIGKRKLAPFRNGLITEKDKEKRQFLRDDWLLHCDIMDSMLRGFGYKEM